MGPGRAPCGEFRIAWRTLTEAADQSSALFLSREIRKVLLVSCASYFESEICKAIDEFVHERSAGCPAVCAVVRDKVTSRDYFKLFEWKSSNANKFFASFGEAVRSRFEAAAKADEELKDSVRAFLTVGLDRNRLVHDNYASFTLEATPEELLERFELAYKFVESVPAHLRGT